MATNQMIVPPVNTDDALLLPLGSGQAAELTVGDKGTLLDKAAAYGLSVPTGYIVLHRVLELGIAHDYLKVEDNQVLCANPKAFYAALNLPKFAGKKVSAMVRSAFSVEDTPDNSDKDSAVVMGVDPNKPAALIDALCAVWSAGLAYPNARHDVLVLQQAEAVTSGVVYSDNSYEDDHVSYVEGGLDALLADDAQLQHVNIRRLRLFERGDNEEGVRRADATWQDRVQVLMRRVRDLMGNRGVRVEWVDDGTMAYIVRIGTAAGAAERNEWFALSNHRELFPDLPSRYMVSMMEASAAELYDWYRQFDGSLPKGRPFIEVFDGRPYINMSLMTETMRALGLPTSLVTDNLGADADGADGLRWKRAVSKLPALAQLGAAQLNAQQSAEKTIKLLADSTLSLGDTFGEVNKSFRKVYVAFVHEMFNLSQALAVPMMMLRGSEKLDAVFAAERTITSQLYDDLLPLRDYVSKNPDLEKALAKGELPNDPEFKRRWGLYMAKFGHRGMYESDIARPRFHEAPSALLSALLDESVIATAKTTGTDELGPVAKQAQRMVVARERLYHEGMRAFDRIRTKMLDLAAVAVEHGQLPDIEAVWDLTLEETALLDIGWQPEADFIEERRVEIAKLAALDVPAVRYRFSDNAPADVAETKIVKGMGLVAGKVKGKAWVLDAPSVDLPKDYTPAETVLVARAIDAGWIPTLSKVAAVVVETGGDLSHGSVILRELKLPSVTAVEHVTRIFETGDVLVVDGETGKVEQKPI